MFCYHTKIRLHHTDAAGQVYFGQVFTLAHECYERFLDEAYPLDTLLATGQVLLPIVHAEADYHRPLKVAEAITIEMTLARLGDRSFHLRYELKQHDGTIAATVKTSHAAIDPATQQSIELPHDLRQALTRLATLNP